MKLDFYHSESCPFCAKVRLEIDRLGGQSQIAYFDISEDTEAESRLRELTGDDQVPCLVVNGIPMLESEELIRWLRANLRQAS